MNFTRTLAAGSFVILLLSGGAVSAAAASELSVSLPIVQNQPITTEPGSPEPPVPEIQASASSASSASSAESRTHGGARASTRTGPPRAEA